jgi:hypothetical protein
MTTYNKRKRNNLLYQTCNAYRALQYVQYINQQMHLTECNKM